jgi:hypothetical protein
MAKQVVPTVDGGAGDKEGGGGERGGGVQANAMN